MDSVSQPASTTSNEAVETATFSRIFALADFASGVARMGESLATELLVPTGDKVSVAIYAHLSQAFAVALDAMAAHIRTLAGGDAQ